MWLNRCRIVIVLLVAFLSVASGKLSAQRVVTPVETNDLPYDIQKKKTAAADSTAIDSVPPKKPIHNAPLFGGLLLTADLASPVMNLFGTQYGNYEVALEADFFHRFFPVVEVGIGMANYKPQDNNYTFKCDPVPYMRLGVNYNFFYNNGSESFFSLGVRYGLTGFSYAWEDVTIGNSYWDSETVVSTPKHSSFAHWGEIVVGLRVQVYKNFYMGWSGRYRYMFSCGTSPYGDPYFVPGFGPKAGGWGFTYTIGYSIPIKSKSKEETVIP